ATLPRRDGWRWIGRRSSTRPMGSWTRAAAPRPSGEEREREDRGRHQAARGGRGRRARRRALRRGDEAAGRARPPRPRGGGAHQGRARCRKVQGEGGAGDARPRGQAPRGRRRARPARCDDARGGASRRRGGAPPNELSPSDLARAAAQVAKERRLAIQVHDRAECRRMGMGAFLGVAAGSAEPPKFIHLTYAPPGRRQKRVALVGKGITFDSGGLDLKTSEGMLRMKYDMAG